MEHNDTESNFYFHRDAVSENRGHHTVKKHYHSLFEIYYITEGSCRYFINNKSYQLIPGDVILIPEGVIHNTEYANTIHKRMLINCSRRFIPASVLPMISSKFFLYRNPDIVNDLNYIFKKIEEEYLASDSLREDILCCYTHMLFFLLAKNVNTCLPVDAGNEYIERAIDYLQQNFLYDISLSEVAEIYSVSPEHFSRMFKKKTGFGFCEYINLLRLQKAESLLKTYPDASVAEIAAKCGFNDSNYFSVKFTKFYGISPKKLQNINK